MKATAVGIGILTMWVSVLLWANLAHPDLGPCCVDEIRRGKLATVAVLPAIYSVTVFVFLKIRSNLAKLSTVVLGAVVCWVASLLIDFFVFPFS